MHPFVIQGQRGKDILTHEKMSSLSIPCKSPATGQEPRGAPAKAILPAGHERKVPTFSSSPAQHCRNSKGVTIVKNQSDCLSNQNLSGNALHLPSKMPGTHFCSHCKRAGGKSGKQKPGTIEWSVAAKAEAGLHGGDDPSKVSQPANGRPRNNHKTPRVTTH